MLQEQLGALQEVLCCGEGRVKLGAVIPHPELEALRSLEEMIVGKPKLERRRIFLLNCCGLAYSSETYIREFRENYSFPRIPDPREPARRSFIPVWRIVLGFDYQDQYLLPNRRFDLLLREWVNPNPVRFGGEYRDALKASLEIYRDYKWP